MGQPQPVPVSAYFQPESRSGGAPITLKLRFHIHMPYFSQAASINGSAQTPVLKISGFQRNPSEALCAASDGWGPRRVPRGSPATAAPAPAGSRALPGAQPPAPSRRLPASPPRCPGPCPAGPALRRGGRAGGSPAPLPPCLPPGPGTQKLSRLSRSLVSGSSRRAL